MSELDGRSVAAVDNETRERVQLRSLRDIPTCWIALSVDPAALPGAVDLHIRFPVPLSLRMIAGVQKGID